MLFQLFQNDVLVSRWECHDRPCRRRLINQAKPILRIHYHLAQRMLLWMRVRAVSVLWPFLYADWKVSFRLAFSRWQLSLSATTFSVAFEIKLRFEIGLKFLNISWSRESFLRMRSTTACLKAVGTLAFSKDRLLQAVRCHSMLSSQ